MKETGGSNLQCFRRKTLKMTLSWASKSYLQQALILQERTNTPAGFSATALPKLPQAVQSPVRAHKAEAASQPQQAAVCSHVDSMQQKHSSATAGAGRKLDRMQDQVLWSWWH